MKQVLLDSRLFVSGADLSGVGNKIEVNEEAEAKNVTNWRSGGARELLAGISAVEAAAEGQWEAGVAGSVDDSMWANRRVLEPWSFSDSGESDLAPGNLMYLTKMLRTKSQLFGQVGEVAGWSLNAKGAWPLVRGLSMHASGVPRTALGNGTPAQLGAVAADQHVYCNLHLLDVAGTGTPTLTVNVASDDGVGFASSTARGSFAARTTVGGEAIRIPGPITDDWWRVTWTVSGSSPSFLFLVSMGIE